MAAKYGVNMAGRNGKAGKYVVWRKKAYESIKYYHQCKLK